MRRTFTALLLALFLCGCAATEKHPAPKYVFFFIGDGFGLAQAYITQAYQASLEGEIAPKELTLTSFPASGTYTTYCHGRLITDSAAGGTALATGHKTTNGTVGLDHRGERVESIAETFHKNGKKVGIISTASIDHATPACFYAHQPSRDMYYEISQELPLSGFEFFGGGGFLEPEGNGPSIYEQAARHGYRIVDTAGGIDSLRNGDTKVIAVAPNLQDEMSVTNAIDRKPGDLSLADFVEKAIEVLDNPNGFFIMAEGGKIDWMCHANDVGGMVREVEDFDRAIAVAVEFYRQHPDETLIVVGADHETGGLTPGTGIKEYDSDYAVYADQKASYHEFGKLVAACRNSGKHDFQKGLDLIDEYFGLQKGELTGYDLKRLRRAFDESMLPRDERERGDEALALYGGYDPFTAMSMRVLAEKAGVGSTTFAHTGIPVVARALGQGAGLFEGKFDNTDLPKKILSLYE